MVEPALAEPSIDDATGPDVADDDDGLDATGGEIEPETDADGTPETDADPNVAEIELSDDDFSGGGGLFDGVEDASDGDDTDGQESEADGDDGDGDGDGESEDILDGLDGKSAQLEGAINSGAARLAVVGLDSDEKGDLEGEFTEVFEAFRLGYFGSQVFEEYMAPQDGDVSPEWGLLGAILCASAFVLWMRPDGEDQISRMKDAVNGLIGGDGGDL